MNSNSWVGGGHGNTALSLGRLALLNENVSAHSPSSSPRVLDLPVVSAGEGSVSDGEDTVVEVGSALSGEDSARVELESVLVGLNGNGNWLLGHSLGKLSLRVDGDVSVRVNVGGDGARLAGAGITGSVRVRSLSADTLVGDDVLEGVVHKSSIARHISLILGAIHELLLRKADELILGDEPGSLDGSSGGKGPA